MSQQQNQNLPLVPQSEAGVKPFSIRQYVLSCRHRNISQNWPFEEKHLQLCLENGVKLEELLPPLEPGKTSHECNYKVSNHPSSHEHEEGKQSNHENCSKKSGNLSLAEVSPPMAVKHKRKRRKGKCKKRLMVDILAVAQHSTLEEIDGVNRFCD